MCITETWLHAGINDDCISLPGFNLYRCDRISRSGGGVCIYVQNAFRCVNVNHFAHPISVEMVSMKIPILNLFLVCTYVPPNLKASDLCEISDTFTEMIDSLLLANPDSNIMITGDFNNFDSSVFLQQFSLHNCVIAPTRKDSFLDQIWINSALASQYADNASTSYMPTFELFRSLFCYVGW